MKSLIAQNIETIHRRMDAAAVASQRTLSDIALIAVSKTHDVDAVSAALAAGQRGFGENRVQEAEHKFPALRMEFPDIELHLIGALQTNKAEDAVRLFDVIETLDRPRLADAVARAVQKIGRSPRCYIEVNIGDEVQKAGMDPSNVESFLHYCRSVCGLTVDGLMCIPPHDADPAPYFTKMKALADHLHLPHLSMGMSSDFEKAIACGATEVRVGTAIFGARPSKEI